MDSPFLQAAQQAGIEADPQKPAVADTPFLTAAQKVLGSTDEPTTPVDNPFLTASKQAGIQPVDSQENILSQPSEVTQRYGTYNPGLEVFSGGVAGDTNFATPAGTPVALPPGKWEVVKTYDTANPVGHIGNSENEGYGNAIMVQNKDTGEKLHFIHLSDVHVKPGSLITGGKIIGKTGSSGNATGDNLGLEYYDKSGKLGEVLDSSYGKYLPVKN